MDNYAVHLSSTVCYPSTTIADTIRCFALFALKLQGLPFQHRPIEKIEVDFLEANLLFPS